VQKSLKLAVPALVFAVAASAAPAQAAPAAAALAAPVQAALAAPAQGAAAAPRVLTATAAPRTLPVVKATAQARIDRRLRTLATLKTAIGDAKNLTDAHRATLTSLVDSDTAGLTALRAKVDGAQSVEAVRADERSMVVDYRIYLLVVPKVRFTIAADAETAAIETLRSVHDTLADAIAAAQAKGEDVSVEQAELTDLQNRIDAASKAIEGKADGLLAVTPSADAGAMMAAVNSVRAAVRTARQDLRTAIGDARQIRRQLA
jgi:hypothetical protein